MSLRLFCDCESAIDVFSVDVIDPIHKEPILMMLLCGLWPLVHHCRMLLEYREATYESSAGFLRCCVTLELGFNPRRPGH